MIVGGRCVDDVPSRTLSASLADQMGRGNRVPGRVGVWAVDFA
jgi:hypothetical protein